MFLQVILASTPGHWRNVMACLDNDLKFTSTPTGTGIPVGSTLFGHSPSKRFLPVGSQQYLSF